MYAFPIHIGKDLHTRVTNKIMINYIVLQKAGGDIVYIKQFGNAVVLLPQINPRQSPKDSLDKFSVDFMVSRDQAEQEDREGLFQQVNNTIYKWKELPQIP